ncbi:TPA: hypothetical protein ACH3X1_006135 [Trebouxia sp. C0004]
MKAPDVVSQDTIVASAQSASIKGVVREAVQGLCVCNTVMGVLTDRRAQLSAGFCQTSMQMGRKNSIQCGYFLVLILYINQSQHHLLWAPWGPAVSPLSQLSNQASTNQPF